jgi:hypothetical protein
LNGDNNKQDPWKDLSNSDSNRKNINESHADQMLQNIRSPSCVPLSVRPWISSGISPSDNLSDPTENDAPGSAQRIVITCPETLAEELIIGLISVFGELTQFFESGLRYLDNDLEARVGLTRSGKVGSGRKCQWLA